MRTSDRDAAKQGVKLAQMAAFDGQTGLTSLAMCVSVSNACTLSTHKKLLHAGQQRLTYCCQGKAQSAGRQLSIDDRQAHGRGLAAVINKSGLDDHMHEGSATGWHDPGILTAQRFSLKFPTISPN